MKAQGRYVAIVGVGLIGRAWAAIFARAGWNVRLTEPHAPTLAAAPDLIRDELHALARHGLAADPDGAAARITVAGSVEDAMPRRDRLRVISGSGRRRTARRGKLAIVGSARPLVPCSDGTQAASGGC